MTTRGSMGWVILVLSLSVPLFMFYKKYTEINTERKNETPQKIIKRVPDSMLFDQQNSDGKLTNPMNSDAKNAAAAAAAQAMTPAVSTVSVAVQAPPVKAPATPPVKQAAAAPAQPVAVSAPAPAPLVPAEQPGKVAGGVDASTEAVVQIKDPTLSPYDVYQLEQAALEALLRQKEVETAVTKVRAKSKEPPIESTINLQGIISNPDGGNKAIVNDEVVSIGDMVGKAKVLSISNQSVTFQYKTKKFKKYVRD